MKFEELLQRNIEELKVLLQESRSKLDTLRFESASQTLKDNSQIRKLTKEIARILTAMHKIQYTG